ncbi:MAG: plasmid pRiA4b ORF-3 family protein, partial [Spirochaetales bacterium]|nr:plasmid pRiA4b ORF-3 family protein [Spirochaetales bacterium]
ETGKLKEIGMPDDPGFSEFPVLAGWEVKLADWFSEKNNKVDYTYDFGDDWNHEVVLEKVLPKESGKRYPVCLDGKRACPPEDCGGVYGYERFLEIIKNPDDEEYKETMAWCDEDFDPDYFDCNEIKFDSPKKRLKYMFDF